MLQNVNKRIYYLSFIILVLFCSLTYKQLSNTFTPRLPSYAPHECEHRFDAPLKSTDRRMENLQKRRRNTLTDEREKKSHNYYVVFSARADFWTTLTLIMMQERERKNVSMFFRGSIVIVRGSSHGVGLALRNRVRLARLGGKI